MFKSAVLKSTEVIVSTLPPKFEFSQNWTFSLLYHSYCVFLVNNYICFAHFETRGMNIAYDSLIKISCITVLIFYFFKTIFCRSQIFILWCQIQFSWNILLKCTWQNVILKIKMKWCPFSKSLENPKELRLDIVLNIRWFPAHHRYRLVLYFFEISL